MHNSYSVKDALEFMGKSFALTEDLKSDLQSSKMPSIILIVGPARSGKSTLANILLKPAIHQENEPFKTQEGNRPVTMKIQYVKINLSDILTAHNLDVSIDFDPELLIFDCEGINSLDITTQSLRKAIFTFMQISTVNIYVSKMIDLSNIHELKSLFTLPQLIGTKTLSRGSAIILTDSGVPGNPSESEYEDKRRSNDQYELGKILSFLKEKNIEASKENLVLFAQPKWNNEKHYFESINDLIKYIVNTISNRIPIPGPNIIQIFEKFIPIISKLDDLDDPNIRLDQIVNNLIDYYFKVAYEYAIEQSNDLIQIDIEKKSANELISLSKPQYCQEIQLNAIHIFTKKANEIFNNITECFPEKTKPLIDQMRANIQQKFNDSFEKRCQVIVIPFISDQVMNQTKEKILIDLRDTKDTINSLNTSELVIKYQKYANDLFDEKLRPICDNLISSIFYTSQVKNNNSLIAQEVLIFEQNERIKRLEKQREDSDTTINQLIEKFKSINSVISDIFEKQKKNVPKIGTFFFSMRTEDKLHGSLRCNGQTVNVSEYPDFVEKYLKTNLVATVTIAEWNHLKETNNNVGFFGYDPNGGIFIVPYISSGSFLSNSEVGTVNNMDMKAGTYFNDQIVNITGSTLFKILGTDWNQSNSGALSNHVAGCWSTNIRCNGGGDDWNRVMVIDFDASKSVRTGDRVMPKTIFHKLFIVVSENE